MRTALTVLLSVLMIISVGLLLGYLSLNVSARVGGQLSAAGLLAYHEEYWPDGYYYREYPDGSTYEYDPNWWQYRGYAGSEVIYEDWDGSLVRETIEYDPWGYDYGWGREYVVDEWVEPNPYYSPTLVAYDPWYVQAFPGVGQFAQRILPTVYPAVAPTPPPPPPPTPRIVYPQPSCWISASPTTVGSGGSSTLTWQSYNASQAILSDFGGVSLSGSRIVSNLTAERIYSLSVSGQGGSNTCYTRISVQPQNVTPSCIISAHPEEISLGENTSLAWGSNDASSALLSGIGAVPINGGLYVAPQETTTYSLTVFGSGNRSSSCSARVTVFQAVP
ncbi:MAG: hypothetical protein HY460_00790 [Parcubacteria group bacterium]|nr:hypothetical protein [Parcubacteria group bacterium]